VSTFVVVGPTIFPADSAIVSRRIQTLRSPAKVPYAERHIWDVQIRLIDTGPVALATDARAFEAALGRQFQDISFQTETGAVLWSLPTGTSIGGTQVTDLVNEYEQGSWATFYPLRFTAEAVYPYSGAGGVIITAFQESVSFSGGGPRYGFVECVNSPAKKFMLTPRTVAHATQSGSMTTIGGQGSFPTPLFPADEMPEQTRKEFGSRINAEGLTEYFLAWSYEYASANLIVV
jgi:hypothetical protein